MTGLQVKKEISGYERVILTSTGSEFFDLACWNIEWFGTAWSTNKERIINVADYMHALGMNLWGLVEVSQPALEGIRKVFDENYNQKFAYFLGESNTSQYPAIFYETSKIECEPMDAGEAFDGKWDGKLLFPRKPLWIYVRVKGISGDIFDFNLLVLHLKAMGDDDSVRQRTEEVKVLNSWLNKRTRKDPDKDYILVGDWNDRIDSSSFNNLLKDNKLAILTHEDAESREKNAVSYVRGNKKSLLDHIVISKDAINEYKDKSIEIVRSNEVIPKYAGRPPAGYSDHIPIVARFIYNR
jgi:endonuclease/exonuclease/phosphatase family metal-dependent hydrolase